jgi:hypothetical protein
VRLFKMFRNVMKYSSNSTSYHVGLVVLHSGLLNNGHPAVISHRSTAICSRACRVCLAIFEMVDARGQRINIKFCLKLEKMFTKTR